MAVASRSMADSSGVTGRAIAKSGCPHAGQAAAWSLHSCSQFPQKMFISMIAGPRKWGDQPSRYLYPKARLRRAAATQAGGRGHDALPVRRYARIAVSRH